MLRRTIACGLLLLLCAAARSASRPDEIPFEKHTIDLGASETAAFADINRDGKPDLVSGEYWYEAPHWTKHRFRDLLYTNFYIDDLSTLPLDVDGDGYIDLVTSGWFSNEMSWVEKSRPRRGHVDRPHNRQRIAYRILLLVDLDNDGKANEILPQFGDKRPLAWYERDGHGGVIEHIVSDHSYGHGLALAMSTVMAATTFSPLPAGWRRRRIRGKRTGNFTTIGISTMRWDSCTSRM